jgi:hypothetical protein
MASGHRPTCPYVTVLAGAIAWRHKVPFLPLPSTSHRQRRCIAASRRTTLFWSAWGWSYSGGRYGDADGSPPPSSSDPHHHASVLLSSSNLQIPTDSVKFLPTGCCFNLRRDVSAGIMGSIQLLRPTPHQRVASASCPYVLTVPILSSSDSNNATPAEHPLSRCWAPGPHALR